MLRIVLIVHNIRSAHNVGSILRRADGFGVEKFSPTCYTPYPLMIDDNRLPHAARRAAAQIAKTALGAEKTLNWQPKTDVLKVISKLKKNGFLIVALEQTKQAINLSEFGTAKNLALIVGSEIGGLEPVVLEKADTQIEIPMLGNKESFNVAVAAAIALYHLRWYNR